VLARTQARFNLNITISHPHGNPNSYHAARAFADAGLLRTFEHGLSNKGSLALLLAIFAGKAHKLRQRECDIIPPKLQRQHLSWEAISHLGRRVKATGPTARVSWYDVLFCGHDWQVARGLQTGTGAVYAYEDGARHTFRAAKCLQATTIYELPAGYYAGASHELKRVTEEKPELPIEIKDEPEWKVRRKDDELKLADLIVVPCEWAAASLRFSNVGAIKKVVKVPYGTPADELPARNEPPTGPFTVLFAGQVGVRKGVPHLLEAWGQLRLKDAHLLLAGGMRLDKSFLSRHPGSCKYVGQLSRRELLEFMKRVDLLVFPSLAEGFGLVIGEAMAAGTPVLTTTNTGGPELISDGLEGWCVPAHDVTSLAEKIEWSYLNRKDLFEMGRLARRKAEQWTWSHYRSRLAEVVTSHLKSA
jgi:alpha-maltose-1-phosphate synthase